MTDFLIPGPPPTDITDGGGAAAVTVDVMNAMWSNAQYKADAAIKNANMALSLAVPAPQVAGVVLDKSYLPPPPPELPNYDPSNAELMYQTHRDYLLGLIEDKMAQFIVDYLPPEPFFQLAYDWATRALTTGGSGINVNVEQALWQRGRARILADSARAEREADTLWAMRGFPMPPGALLGARQDIQLDAGRKLAEVNRDIAVKSFEAELENARLAFKEVMDFRKVSLNMTLDYVKTIMSAPQLAAQITGEVLRIRTELARNLTMLYSAMISALQPHVQLAIQDAELQLRAQQLNQSAQVNSLNEQVKAALLAVQLLASQSAAGINAIGARSSISGADSSTIPVPPI